MTDKELEQAGREMFILETLAKISALKQEIAGYEARYGSYEALEAEAAKNGAEDFEADEAHNAWRWAREYLEALQGKLAALRSDAAA